MCWCCYVVLVYGKIVDIVMLLGWRVIGYFYLIGRYDVLVLYF